MALRVGYEKLNRETGWKPKVSWEEGVRRTIAWYAANRDELDRTRRLARLKRRATPSFLTGNRTARPVSSSSTGTSLLVHRGSHLRSRGARSRPEAPST